ncbi:hypothetical protein T06_8447, partial [Trichinella sp. T6]
MTYFLEKIFSYNDIEAQCNGMGQSEDCTIQFENPDMAKVTLTCIVRKDVKPNVTNPVGVTPPAPMVLYGRGRRKNNTRIPSTR